MIAGQLSCAAALGLIALSGAAAAANKKDAFTDAAPPTPAVAAPAAPSAPAARALSSRQENAQAERNKTLKRWAALAAEGNAAAQLKLGRSYRVGQGTAPDTRNALRWLTAAARANLPAAHYQLGLLHMSGGGDTSPDLVEAYARFKVAAAAGDVRATALIFYIGVRMTGAELRAASERIAEIQRDAITAPQATAAAEKAPPENAATASR